MKKKFLALVLTLAMVLSLVPATALATEGTPTLDNDTESVTASQDGVNITKKVVQDGDNYNLVMEAYVEGTTTTTTSTKPLDIVLVLDVSGSMDDPMGNRDRTKRIDALKSAVKAFIEKVAEKNTDAIGHRISIVKFAGDKKDNVGNDTYREGQYTYNNSQIVENLITVDDVGKAKLTDAVNSLKPAGATRADYGMQLAQSVLPSSDGEANRDKVVVMFTDGSPNSSNGFEYDVASGAISASKALKDKDVKVYTIGIFSGANPKADVTKKKTSAENKYMHAMSSNYPDATLTSTQTGFLGSTEWHWNFGTRAQGSNYYLSAKNSTELNNVFQTISNSITTTQVKAGTSAVLRDTLTDQFVLNGDENKITVQTAAVTGKDKDGKYTWGEPASVDVEKTIDGETVTVKGFNYTSEDNVITENNGKYSGHKLIVTIPIKVNEAYEGWKAGTKNYDTNTTGDNNKAGLTGYTKGTDTNASTLLEQSPQVPVTAYTVTYNWGENAPARENIPTNSNTYLTGKTYPVDTTYAKGKEITDSDGGTWHFSGWTDPNNGVMGTKNVTITGSWTHTEPTQPDPTYTLTYDANGGKFGSDGTKMETINQTGDHALNYTSDYIPTYTNHIFLGWSIEPKNVLTKADVNDATTIASSITTKVDIPSVQTVYAVWSLDENNNDIPDVFEATIIYKIENGKWTKDGAAIGSDNITATFQLYEQQDDHTWKATDKLLWHGNFPAGYTGNKGYTGLGWYRNSETTPSPSELVRPTTKVIDAVTDAVTGAVTGAETVFTYKYAPTTPETYTVVLHLEGGSYTTTPDTYTENSDGIYQYNVTKTDAVINPESPSRNNFGFEGWSLSESAPQTLISEDAAFANLYLEQSGMSGNFDKIDLYAVWKEAEPPTPADPVEWDVSRSKIASGLTKNSNGEWTTNVTLSLPSAEEKLESDVVFVMDGSSSTDANVVTESLKLLEDLQEAVKQSNAAVNVCVVKFKRQAFKSEWFDLSKNFNDIKNAMVQKYSGGTNIHAGLLAGKEALKDHTNVSANRKYLILVSDGSTYLYSKDGNWASDTPFTRSYYTKENYNGFAGGFNDQGLYNPSNGPTGYDPRNVARPTKTSDVAAWQAYLNDVKARNETVNSESKTGDDYDYHCEYDNNFNKGIPSADFKSQPCEPRTANNRDMAFYYADQTWQEMKEDGYHLFSIATEDGSAGAGNADDSHSFMNYLNEGVSLNFSDIKNDIFYAVGAGSVVEDKMGADFDFVPGSLKLTVDGKALDFKVDGDTTYFGAKNTESNIGSANYRFKVEYNSTEDKFTWTINENVSNFAPVQLTYTVKLTGPKTAAGTYGVKDLNGDGKVDGTGAAFTDTDKNNALYTNESATMVPKDSNGTPGKELTFPKPSVSYTIKGSSGGHGGNGGGTVTIPDDVPTGLNGKDHYAYVVGYPDGMVYPQKNITRAEVATIFFRLLTDETREANMTKSNSYNDMKDGAWYTCAVSTLSKMGIIKGYEDGSFKPDASISRAEFAAIAARFDPDGDKTPATFSDVSSHWAKDEISIAANHGWIKGYEDGSFKPDQKITRAETMTLVNRVLKRLPETKDDLHKDMKTWPDNQNESAWFYLAVQEATNSHYQKLKKDGTHETWESMRETRDWAALEK